VDATIAMSTFALVVLGDKPTGGARAPRNATTASADSQVKRVRPTATAMIAAPQGATRVRDLAAQAAASAVRPRKEPATPDEWSRRDSDGLDSGDLAVALVDSKVTRQPIDVVRSVLEAHDNGVALNRIAKDVGVHHTAVKRIVDAAATHRRTDLAAVG
jgi:hypothetical protein